MDAPTWQEVALVALNTLQTIALAYLAVKAHNGRSQ